MFRVQCEGCEDGLPQREVPPLAGQGTLLLSNRQPLPRPHSIWYSPTWRRGEGSGARNKEEGDQTVSKLSADLAAVSCVFLPVT